MLTKAFLSPAEIEERIAQEAASDKDRRRMRSGHFFQTRLPRLGRLILEPWMPLPRNWSISMAISWVCHLLSVS